jgi:hypothetical protein
VTFLVSSSKGTYRVHRILSAADAQGMVFDYGGLTENITWANNRATPLIKVKGRCSYRRNS